MAFESNIILHVVGGHGLIFRIYKKINLYVGEIIYRNGYNYEERRLIGRVFEGPGCTVDNIEL